MAGGPTRYEDVNEALGRLLPRIREVLQEHFEGAYLYGSATVGAFDGGISDIDLLITVSSTLGPAEVAALQAMHREFAHEQPEWEDRLDVQYLPVKALQTFKQRATPMLRITPGDGFGSVMAGADWAANWYEIQRAGTTLAGPDPASFMDAVSDAEFIAVVTEYATDWANRLPGWPRHRGAQGYVVLTMCRALFSSTFHRQISKEAAAAWAMVEFPEWEPLVREARAARRDPHNQETADQATLEATAAFVRFACERMAGSQPSRR